MDVRGRDSPVDDWFADAEGNISGSKTGSTTLTAYKEFSILNKGVSCPITDGVTFNASVTAGGRVEVNGDLDYTFAISGTIVPPKFTEFAIGAQMGVLLDGEATIGVVATVRASASSVSFGLCTNRSFQVTFDSGKVQIFNMGLPGLDIPG